MGDIITICDNQEHADKLINLKLKNKGILFDDYVIDFIKNPKLYLCFIPYTYEKAQYDEMFACKSVYQARCTETIDYWKLINECYHTNIGIATDEPT